MSGWHERCKYAEHQLKLSAFHCKQLEKLNHSFTLELKLESLQSRLISDLEIVSFFVNPARY